MVPQENGEAVPLRTRFPCPLFHGCPRGIKNVPPLIDKLSWYRKNCQCVRHCLPHMQVNSDGWKDTMQTINDVCYSLNACYPGLLSLWKFIMLSTYIYVLYANQIVFKMLFIGNVWMVNRLKFQRKRIKTEMPYLRSKLFHQLLWLELQGNPVYYCLSQRQSCLRVLDTTSEFYQFGGGCWLDNSAHSYKHKDPFGHLLTCLPSIGWALTCLNIVQGGVGDKVMIKFFLSLQGAHRPIRKTVT